MMYAISYKTLFTGYGEDKKKINNFRIFEEKKKLFKFLLIIKILHFISIFVNLCTFLVPFYVNKYLIHYCSENRNYNRNIYRNFREKN